jgi:dolichol-phosphate mannosyltransferase
MLNAMTLESRGGFEISLEITVKAFIAGYRIAELPTTWRDRTAGESRFRLWHWLPRYLRWYVYAFRPRSAMPPASPKH